MQDCFTLNMSPEGLNNMSSLALAHLGDAVYELFVRSMLASSGKLTSRNLHTASVELVKAPAQAAAAKVIQPLLSQEEQAVFNRARNARVNSVPKAASLGEYHAATALEALFGWLYATGQRGRMGVLFAAIMDARDYN